MRGEEKRVICDALQEIEFALLDELRRAFEEGRISWNRHHFQMVSRIDNQHFAGDSQFAPVSPRNGHPALIV